VGGLRSVGTALHWSTPADFCYLVLTCGRILDGRLSCLWFPISSFCRCWLRLFFERGGGLVFPIWGAACCSDFVFVLFSSIFARDGPTRVVGPFSFFFFFLFFRLTPFEVDVFLPGMLTCKCELTRGTSLSESRLC